MRSPCGFPSVSRCAAILPTCFASEGEKTRLPVRQFRVAAQVPVGVAELALDHRHALEEVADIEFVGHAHAAVNLDGVLADELAGLADLHLGAGGGELALALSASSSFSVTM